MAARRRTCSRTWQSAATTRPHCGASRGSRERDLDDADVSVADASAGEAWRLAEQITGDDKIGLHMAQSIPAGALDILEYRFVVDPTVGSGLDQLVATFGRSAIAPASSSACVAALPLAEAHAATSGRVRVRPMCWPVSPRHIPRPPGVHFAHRPPQSRLEHRAFFRSPVRFDESSARSL